MIMLEGFRNWGRMNPTAQPQALLVGRLLIAAAVPRRRHAQAHGRRGIRRLLGKLGFPHARGR